MIRLLDIRKLVQNTCLAHRISVRTNHDHWLREMDSTQVELHRVQRLLHLALERHLIVLEASLSHVHLRH